MCKYCDYNSEQCEVFFDPLTKEWYLDVTTYEWDYYGDDFGHMRVYISYCPYCGEDLYKISKDW